MACLEKLVYPWQAVGWERAAVLIGAVLLSSLSPGCSSPFIETRGPEQGGQQAQPRVLLAERTPGSLPVQEPGSAPIQATTYHEPDHPAQAEQKDKGGSAQPKQKITLPMAIEMCEQQLPSAGRLVKGAHGGGGPDHQFAHPEPGLVRGLPAHPPAARRPPQSARPAAVGRPGGVSHRLAAVRQAAGRHDGGPARGRSQERRFCQGAARPGGADGGRFLRSSDGRCLVQAVREKSRGTGGTGKGHSEPREDREGRPSCSMLRRRISPGCGTSSSSSRSTGAV